MNREPPLLAEELRLLLQHALIVKSMAEYGDLTDAKKSAALLSSDVINVLANHVDEESRNLLLRINDIALNATTKEA